MKQDHTIAAENVYLKRKLDYISQNAETILAVGDFPQTVRTVLQSVREYYDADRCSLYEIENQDHFICRRYEVCRPGIAPQIDSRVPLPADFPASWHSLFANRTCFISQQIAAYPWRPETELYHQILQGRSVQGLICVPILENDHLEGLLAVENPQLSADESDFLTTIGKFLANRFLRRHQEEEFQKRYQEAVKFVDSAGNSYVFAARVNVTRDYIETMRGSGVFTGGRSGMSYSDDVNLMLSRLDEKNREKYRNVISREAILAAFAAGHENISAEVYYQSESGSFIWTKTSAKLMRQPDTGELIAFLTQTDVTKERIQDIIMQNVLSQDYDYIMCIRGLENANTVISNNPSRPDYEEMYDSNDFMGNVRLYAEKHLSPEDRQSFIDFINPQNVWRQLATSKVCSATFRMHFAGSIRYKKLDFYCLNQEYQLLAHVRTDLTEAKALAKEQEQKLMQALSAAEKANAAKSDFLSRMSHDIRTPLNGIIGMTALAQQTSQDAETTSYLEKIDISSHFLLGLVNDILDMSKIESGKMELHLRPYSETEFLAYIDSVIRPLCDAKQLNFQVSTLQEKRPLMIDPVKYTQIYFNLLSNAVKFTPAGGHISLRAEEEPIAGGVRLKAVVSDDGIGMSPEFQQRLFHPFEQENSQRDDSRSGSGLGLAITKRLVDMMNGSITVASTPGKGTSFTLQIPLQFATEQLLQKKKKNLGTIFAGRRVLIAEDNAINCEILMHLLQSRGLSTVLARDGRQALQVFAASKPYEFDAILMDIRMPVMDGIASAKQIRQLPREDAGTVPIIAVTANAYEEDIRACRQAGMNGHLAKPIEPDDLYAILAENFRPRPQQLPKAA